MVETMQTVDDAGDLPLIVPKPSFLVTIGGGVNEPMRRAFEYIQEKVLNDPKSLVTVDGRGRVIMHTVLDDKDWTAAPWLHHLTEAWLVLKEGS